jgi:hypothetical protein
MYELVFQPQFEENISLGVPCGTVVARAKKKKSLRNILFRLGCGPCVAKRSYCDWVILDFYIRKGRGENFFHPVLKDRIAKSDEVKKSEIPRGTEKTLPFGMWGWV